jgi:tetratricopeptide (TPR) repeat protein
VSVRRSAAAFLRRNLREEELGKAGIAMSLALLTVLAAMIAALQGQASIEAQRGKREADRIGLEAIGRDSSATIQVGTAYGVYRRWFEQIERADWAQNQQTIYTNTDDRPKLDALYQAEVAIENWTKTQSDLFGPQYRRPNGNPDTYNYETAVVYRAQTLADEQRQVETDVASAWDGKASDYVTILTIVAVGLFFLGLGSTVARRARPFLAGAGVAFGVGAAIWTVLVAAAPIHRVPQAAIDQVVTAGVAYRDTPNEQGAPQLTSAARNGYQKAIDAATAAIATDADYANAYKMRADIRTSYADDLFFSSGPSAEVVTILQGAVDDYRHYLADKNDDYGAWWNAGWSLYLLGDQQGSVDATNQALIHSPAQFTLYLNRALAFLAGGDREQALADVDEAVRRAAQDSTDSSQYYLGQSDFDIGRLAAIYPAQAEVLKSVQTRLREASVSLRVFGSVNPAADAPQLGSVTVLPVRLKQYQGGTLVEGAPLTSGGSILTTDAVGVRVSIPEAATILGRTVSARVWQDGLPLSSFNVDTTVKNFPVALDLVSPYGRAGFDLDPGAYQLDLYVDGARRYQMDWTVTAAPNQPQFSTTATPLIGRFKDAGFTCSDPQAGDGSTTVNCSVLDTDDTTYYADVTYDAKDRITYLLIAATTPTDNTTNDVNALAHTFFVGVMKLLYAPDVAQATSDWINEQGTLVDDLQIAGTTLRVFGNDAHSRNMDVNAPWP